MPSLRRPSSTRLLTSSLLGGQDVIVGYVRADIWTHEARTPPPRAVNAPMW
jgi:hypothetical protein